MMRIPPSEKRHALSRLLDTMGFDEIGRVEGISIVCRMEAYPKGYDCFRYALNGAPVHPSDFESGAPQGYQEVTEPEKGDLVFYFHRHQDGRIAMHAGVYIGNERMVSKWECGHVYEHDIDTAPSAWGDEVRFLRKADENTGGL